MDDVINKVNIFGYHFASLDIRQDSRIHSQAFESIFKIAQKSIIPKIKVDYSTLNDDEKIKILSKLKGSITLDSFNKNDLAVSILGSIRAMKQFKIPTGKWVQIGI